MRSELEEKLHHALNDLLLFHLVSEKMIMSNFGLRRVRFYLLRHLYQNPGISISRLSVLSFTDVASTSRIVFGFEKDGLVKRESIGSDRRIFTITLTNQGKAIYEKFESELKLDIQKRFNGFENGELNHLLESVQILGDAIKQSILDKEKNI